MNRPTNIALKIAGIALTVGCLGGALAGCGGSDGASASSDGASASSDGASASSDGASASSDGASASSDGASASSTPEAGSPEEFCAKFQGLYAEIGQIDPEDSSAVAKAIKGWVADMEEYGTPPELSDKAREGFEVMVAIFKGVGDDASPEDIQSLGSDISAADNKKVEAFGAWTTKNCVPAAPSDDAS